MAECTQEMFLDRIRAALIDRGEPVALPDTLEVARVVKPDADYLKLFLARVEEAKMQPHRVADEAALADKIAEIVAAVSAKTAIVPEEDIPGRAMIVAKLREKGVQFLDVNDRDAAFSADVGITGVAYAVAETASVAMLSGGPAPVRPQQATPAAAKGPAPQPVQNVSMQW